jgi:hypothetical protein
MSRKIEVPGGEAKARESARQRAVQLARERCELWHALENGPPQAFASFKRDGHSEHVELRTTAGRLWLGGLYYRETTDALSRADLDGAMDALEAAAIHDGPRRSVHVRVADLGDRVFLDLADDAWQVVEVTAEGWRVIPAYKAPVRFRRPNGTEALPIPEKGGSLSDLEQFIHTDPPGLALTAAWLVSACTDRGPAPVLSLGGGHGSAKSTATRVLQRLIDPRGGALRAAPKKDEDLAIAAKNAWVCSFDNLSRVSGDLADGLCRLSTGAAFATRMLYTNGEESIIAARRPVILNSILDIVSRPDLLDRTVSATLQKITDDRRIEESLFWARFDEARPRLLGAVLTALSGALSRWESTHPDNLPRLADFYRLALAVGDALPGGTAAFVNAWDAMQAGAVLSALEASPIGEPLLKLLGARGRWKAPAAELLKELNASRALGVRDGDSWPQTPRGLTSALQRLAPALEATGWHVELGARDASNALRQRLVVICQADAMAERAAILQSEAGMEASQAELQAALEAAS